MSPYLVLTNRPLWETIAQRLAIAKPNAPDLEFMTRLYRSLKAGDKLRCRAEIHAIRKARRGEYFAVIPDFSQPQRTDINDGKQ